MNNTFFVVKKEVKVALREKRILSLGVIIILLLSVALYAGYISYRQQQEMITHNQQEKRKEWLGQGDKHPHIAAHYGTFVFKPKTIFSLFDFGLDTYTGTSAYLEAHYQHEFMFRPAQDHSTMIRFGELSAALVFQLLLPLLIIFLSFSSVTGEREHGTLKLLMSQGISFSTITWGKVLAYSLLLVAVLAPFLLGSAFIYLLPATQDFIPDVTVRLGLLALVYAIYLFTFVTFSVWVSLRSANSRNALLTLLSFWVLLGIILPKTVANAGESLYSLPSMRVFKERIQRDITEGLDGTAARSVRQALLKQEQLEKYDVDSVQQLPFNFEAVRMQAGEEYGNMVYDHHLEQLYAIFHRQNLLGSMVSLFNPYLAVQHLSMGLSGTDLHSCIDFERKVEMYRRELVRRMNEDMALNSKYGEFYQYKAGDELWDSIEDFSYQAPNAFEILTHYWLELLSLAGWLIAMILLLNFSSHKIKPVNG